MSYEKICTESAFLRTLQVDLENGMFEINGKNFDENFDVCDLTFCRQGGFAIVSFYREDKPEEEEESPRIGTNNTKHYIGLAVVTTILGSLAGMFGAWLGTWIINTFLK